MKMENSAKKTQGKTDKPIINQHTTQTRDREDRRLLSRIVWYPRPLQANLNQDTQVSLTRRRPQRPTKCNNPIINNLIKSRARDFKTHEKVLRNRLINKTRPVNEMANKELILKQILQVKDTP